MVTYEREEPDYYNQLDSKNKPNTDFEKFGQEILKIPDYLINRTDKYGNVLIISLHDDNRFIQLTGVIAEIWQRIDGKRKYRYLLKELFFHTYSTQLIYKFITQLLTNDQFSKENQIKTGT